jgi:class 3 adenylate cyclase/predicted ATPase
VAEASRRQLTVLWCDLRDITSLPHGLDPEVRRDVLRATHEVCGTVLARYAGYIAQQRDDGMLAYFGYPQAQEEAALRAIRAGLACLESLTAYQTRLEREQRIALAVRIGIHTGLVVMDTLPSHGSVGPLAVGEAPVVATRLPELAAPNTVLISATTARLVEGFFRCQDLGVHLFPAMPASMHVYRVLEATGVQHRLESQRAHTLPPLAGRTVEVALLHERWSHALDGQGQVVLVSGEPGIGKSRLVWELSRQVAPPGCTHLVFRCAAAHTQSAFYPVITALHRFLQWQPHDPPSVRHAALARVLEGYRFAQAPEVLPLLAALLSVVESGESSPGLPMSPQQQRQRTQDLLIAWLLEEAERRPLLMVWEDLHWADPSTLELLRRFVPHVALARLLVLLTFRPEFQPSWGSGAHFSHLVLPRLGRPQVETMLSGMLAGKTVPAEFVTHVMRITDGVPLFIEELTKMALEQGVLRDLGPRYVLTAPLTLHAIPITLHDTLLARLERLTPGAEVARVAAVLGREFATDVLQAVAPLETAMLRQGLGQLVAAELLVPQGHYPTSGYRFKHALVQEAAYQSLLSQTRLQHHRHIAQVLEAQFPEVATTQPELLAHHYTEAACPMPALTYWQQASQQAIARAACLEAIAHCRQGLAVLATLPASLERQQRELDMQIALGAALMTTRGWADAGVAAAHTRARELCRVLGNLPQHFWALQGLWNFYAGRGELRTAHELAEQMLALAQQTGDTLLLALAHYSLGITMHFLGESGGARVYLEQGFALHDPTRHQAPTRLHDAQHWHVVGRSYMIYLLWAQGFPQQASALLQETLTQAMVWAYPANMAFVLAFATILQQISRDPQATRMQADTLLHLATEQGFPHWGAMATVLRGWALAMQGRGEVGLAQIQHGLQVWKAIGINSVTPYMLSLLADVQRMLGQWTAARAALTEAQALVEATGERWWQAELHRLTGELLLRQDDTPCQVDSAEACFQQALAVARQQHARSLELRAAMSLGRLWWQQGRRPAARQLLAELYGGFSEGFDTADLQETQALLHTWSAEE